ncbi:MAG TPA: energy-coupling factor transporter transmembrane component T [Anaerolineae bacterium]|nr:energy-coupling factor transporter transmembrane component T [Anaerolineae bacterium]
MIHATAWYIWLLAALSVLLGTRNPLYLIVLLAEMALVVEALYAPTGEKLRAPVAPGRFALFVVPAGALFNVLTTHTGATVLLRLPEAIPLLGGPLTLEGLVYGAINGLSLAALFTAFTVLNLAVPIRDLIRLAPRAFYPLAVVVSVAVTFVPTTLRQIQEVREAQAVRGRRMRGLRDWLPLFMPLLIGGLEHALQLAEALTARGFASSDAPFDAPRDQGVRYGLLGALLLLLTGGLLRLAWNLQVWGWLLMLLGAVLFGWALRRAGRSAPRSTYRRIPWTRADTLITLGAALTVIPLWLRAGAARLYSPYPALTLPLFDPWVGLAFLGLTLPVFQLYRARVAAAGAAL